MLNWSKSWAQWYRRALPAYWIYLFCATHFPQPTLPDVPGSDKLAHFAAFAILAFLLWRFAESFNRGLSRRFAWIAMFWLGVYAAADEYLQELPGTNRSASLLDWLADFAGVAAVLLLLEVRRRRAAPPQATKADAPRT